MMKSLSCMNALTNQINACIVALMYGELATCMYTNKGIIDRVGSDIWSYFKHADEDSMLNDCFLIVLARIVTNFGLLPHIALPVLLMNASP